MAGRIRHYIIKTLSSPRQFLLLCVGISFFALAIDGSLWRLYSLHKQMDILEARTAKAENEAERYRGLIQRAKDPKFLEKQAREKFDWVEEDELVFLFPQGD